MKPNHTFNYSSQPEAATGWLLAERWEEVQRMPISPYYDVKRDEQGGRYLEPLVSGFELTRIPLLNKGTAFTAQERRDLGLLGLLPQHVDTLAEQIERLYQSYLEEPQTPIDKHAFLRSLQDRNEVLFYALISRHLEEMMPIIYTPTVGQAVQEFSRIYRVPRGFSVNTEFIDEVDSALSNVPLDDVRIIVATDSSAILGIGDQGFGGMAISIGKLSLYVAGGVAPDRTLPVELSVGTDRQTLIDDPHYLGPKHPRLRGADYDAFMDAFVEAAIRRYPKAIIQWEDFSRDAAFRVLERYRDRVPSFNDDIQGTGAVALAGLISASRLAGIPFTDHRIVVHGGGAGGIGVATALRQGLIQAGLSPEEAGARVFVLDQRGLIQSDRELEAFKRPFAHDPAKLGWNLDHTPGLLETVELSGATALLGLSGVGGAFTEDVMQAMTRNTERPVVFPMSNPTANCEAQPVDVIRWTEGRAIVCTGSPFAPVEFGGETHVIGQGNNAFIFPGLGFGAVLCGARRITDAMVARSAYALAEYTAERHPERAYPPVGDLREVSLRVAVQVIEQANADGVTTSAAVQGLGRDELTEYVRQRAWKPEYLPYRPNAGRAQGGQE